MRKSSSDGDGDVVGVIGLGSMGLPMAGHILQDRGKLFITGRRRIYDDLEQAGAVWCESPRELATVCDVILVMLPDLPQLEDVLAGPDGLLADHPVDLLLMIGSTASPTGVQELATRLDRDTAGAVRVIDCPVSGGEDGAIKATLSIMLGGSVIDTERGAKILFACGTPVALGPVGAGEVAKACNQMIVASTSLALAEAAAMADRSGIDVRMMFDLLAGGYAGSNFLTSRKEKLVTQDYSPSGVAKYMVKDLSFATDVAQATRTNGPLLPALKAAYDELVEEGFGDEDIIVTRKFVEGRK